MSDLTTYLASALAAVFGLAGVGKLWSKGPLTELVLAISELVVAGLLVETAFRMEGLLASLIMTGAYLGYALHTVHNRCHCFGQSLPSTDPLAQRARNAVLFLFAIAGMLTEGTSHEPANMPIFDYAGGAATGIFVVVLPWVLDSVEHGQMGEMAETHEP